MSNLVKAVETKQVDYRFDSEAMKILKPGFLYRITDNGDSANNGFWFYSAYTLDYRVPVISFYTVDNGGNTKRISYSAEEIMSNNVKIIPVVAIKDTIRTTYFSIGGEEK